MTFRIILSIILFCISFIACKFYSAEDYLNDGNNVASTGNYSEAIKLYNEAITKKSDLKEAYIQRGICYENLNQDKLAIENYNSVLKIDNKNTLALFHLGLINFKLDNYKESINFYNKALESKMTSTLKDSTQSPILSDRTNFYGDNFDVPMCKIYYERGLAYYNDRQIENSFNDFQFCIKMSCLLGESYYMTGLCWLTISNKINACEAFKKGALYGDSLSKEEIKQSCN